MKTFVLLTCLMLFSVAVPAFAQSSATPAPGATGTPAAQKYTCTMHPEVVQNKPGKCPKCGMKLVPKEEKKKAEQPKE